MATAGDVYLLKGHPVQKFQWLCISIQISLSASADPRDGVTDLASTAVRANMESVSSGRKQPDTGLFNKCISGKEQLCAWASKHTWGRLHHTRKHRTQSHLRTPYIVVKIRKSADVTWETNKLHSFLPTCVWLPTPMRIAYCNISFGKSTNCYFPRVLFVCVCVC